MELNVAGSGTGRGPLPTGVFAGERGLLPVDLRPADQGAEPLDIFFAGSVVLGCLPPGLTLSESRSTPPGVVREPLSIRQRSPQSLGLRAVSHGFGYGLLQESLQVGVPVRDHPLRLGVYSGASLDISFRIL